MSPRRLRAAVIGSMFLAACRAPEPPPAPPPPPAEVVARFSIAEPLEHTWRDELVHFDADLPASIARGPLHLSDASGSVLPAEFEPAESAPLPPAASDRVRGRLWTVVTLPAKSTASLALETGAAPSAVTVRREPSTLVIANDRIEISLPIWTGAHPDITALPSPIRAVRRRGAWIGEGAFHNEGPPLPVATASTAILAEGPVRAAVRHTARLADGRFYEAVISLAARQEAALVTEESDIDAPQAGFRLTFSGSVLWNNQYAISEGRASWGVYEEPPGDRESLICDLHPWTYWWMPHISEFAGFRAPGADTMVGVLALRPSRWRPSGEIGFTKSKLPVTARPGGRADVAFQLAADGATPMHREWALSATPIPDGALAARRRTLRAELVKYSEFPLDEVKDYGFDRVPPRPHPSLLFGPEAVARARRQARESPLAAAPVRAAEQYLIRASGHDRALAERGPLGFYELYAAHYLYERLPHLYLGSDDPRYARFEAAAVEGLAKRLVDLFVAAPERPALSAYGPWVSEEVTRLLLNWDLAAAGMPPDREAFARRALLLGARALHHADFWNEPLGLAGATPNLRSSVAIPRGLLGVALSGLPEADRWAREGEEHLLREIHEWSAPGGAWVECPAYHVAALDGLFLLATAIARAGGRDHFTNPRFKETLDYLGFLLTPPDRRFPPGKAGSSPSPSVLPSIGDTIAGLITPFNGWAAAMTAKTDPAFSARQQFYWKMQNATFENGLRAKGFAPALTDLDLPAAPPTETARAFPGFGSVLRSSWTDPRASYVAHRTGPHDQHYQPGEYGSFTWFAKGAPLCVDWGNHYMEGARAGAWEHNAVSFETGGQGIRMTGRILGVKSLPGFAEASAGRTEGSGKLTSLRDLLLVLSPDPMGANYLVIRDRASGGAPGQHFWQNFHCLSKEPETKPGYARFPGQLGVDVEAFFLSPDRAALSTGHWSWKGRVYLWEDFGEEQHAVRAIKEGSNEDFFTVLYPRAPGERAPAARALANGAAARVDHAEGTDVVLMSPGKPASVREAGAALEGEMALARRGRSGRIRLAVIAGAGASATLAGFNLASDGPAAVDIDGSILSGVSSGPAHVVRIILPPWHRAAVVQIDGAEVSAARDGGALVLPMPAGIHRFTLSPR